MCAASAGTAQDSTLAPPPATDGPADLLPDPETLLDIDFDPAVRRLVAQLGDPSYAVRERATQSLLDVQVAIPQLCALLSDDALSPEQRYRLLAVLQRQIVNRPRGALGIRMQMFRDPGGAGGGIEVVDLVPGLPAEHVLQLRDRIWQIDGRSVRSQDDLALLIQSRLPGEIVHLRIDRPRRDAGGARMRDEEGAIVYDTIDIELELGSVDELVDPENGTANISSTVLQRRLRQAREAARRYAPRPRPIRLADGRSVVFGRAADGAAGPDRPVEDHPDIRFVREQRRLIAEGRLELTEAVREGWRDRLRSLIRRSEAADLDPADRLYLQWVAWRLAELIER